MPYAPLPALSGGDTFSLAIYDIIRENFAVGAPDVVAAKGDLVAGLTTDSIGRVAVGANGATLVPDSSQATGLVWQTQPAVRAYHNAAQGIAAGSWTTLSFNQERFDTDGMHSTATNPSRFTVPTGGAGLYLVGITAEIQAAGDRTVGLRAIVNGATTIARWVGRANNPPQAQGSAISALWSLNVGDYVEFQAYCDDGSGSVVVLGAWSPEAWLIWQRRQ